MAMQVGMKSWFTETLDSLKHTLVEHRTALEQLRAAMEQESYVDDLQLDALMEVQVVLDEAGVALGDACSRLTAAYDLTDSSRRKVPPLFGGIGFKTHLEHAGNAVEATHESLNRLNIRMRAIVVLFTSDTTQGGLVGSEVAIARGLMPVIFQHWDSALESIAKAVAEFN